MQNTIPRYRLNLLVAAVGVAMAVLAGSDLAVAQASEPGQKPVLLTGHRGSVKSVAYSPDGKRIASGGEDRVVRVRDSVDGRELLALKGHSGQIESVKFSLDGKWLASGSADGSVRIWDAASGEERQSMGLGSGHLRDIAFSPDGKRIASVAVHSRTVTVWDIASGKAVLALQGPLEWCGSVAFSPDGKRLATCSSVALVSEWEIASGKQTHSLNALLDRATAQFVYQKSNPTSNFVYSVAYRPDGGQIAACSSDSLVRVWNVTPGP